MSQMAITKEIKGSVDEVCERVTEAIKPFGFGILTRIDFDKKIKEKLGESLSPCTILGACHPKLAFEAYKQSTDVALLIPCNITVTEVKPGFVRVEAVRPTIMLKMLPAVSQRELVETAEKGLETAISKL